jgi:hypothetical protein
MVGIGMCLVLFSHLLYLWHFTMAVFIDAKNSGQIKLRFFSLLSYKDLPIYFKNIHNM